MHEPVFACLLADGLVKSGHTFRRDTLIEPGFENELCIVLDRDLPPNATRTELEEAGFEPSVPLANESVSSARQALPV